MPLDPNRRSIPALAVESIWHAPGGHAVRRIDWPAMQTARGSILYLPGRGDSYEKWLESLAYWAGEGWAVTSTDWRGQGLSGRLGRDAMTGHVSDFDVWISDLAVFWQEWAAERPGPHILIAHSMGGHIALRAVADNAVRPDALVMTAPMLGLHPAWVPSRVLHAAARLIAGSGDRRRAAWKGGEKPELIGQARSLLLTHDAERYADEQHWRSTRPGIAMGAASWGWIERALTSIRILESPGLLEAVDVPTLILATRYDGLVSWPAIRRASSRIPRSELVVFGHECRHEILREVDSVRNHALVTIDDFLNRFAPVRA